jgi:hypothetical protein
MATAASLKSRGCLSGGCRGSCSPGAQRAGLGCRHGVADAASDTVKFAYADHKILVAAKLAGNKSAELSPEEHAADPDTWQAPLSKALTASGAAKDAAVLKAAQLVMAVLDQAGTIDANTMSIFATSKVSK